MDVWKELATQALASGDPGSSPAFARLYELAHAVGPVVLRGLGVGPEDAKDLISDLLLGKLHLILGAAEPRPYFCHALKNRAKDRLKKPATRVAEDRPRDAPGEAHTVRAERGLEAALYLPVVKALLTKRERQVFAALADGFDREAVAAAFKVQRPAIDQIVSRARTKLRRAGLL